MIVQDIYLPEYRWHCRIFYSVDGYWVADILHDLREIGCAGRKYRVASRNLNSGQLNTGLTFSNKEIGKTVMVIAKTSSADEFAHSYDHEKGHLAMHVAQAYGIDPYGEEAVHISRKLHLNLLNMTSIRKRNGQTWD